MKEIKEWLDDYCKDEWISEGVKYNVACIRRDGRVIMSNHDMVATPKSIDWCFPHKKRSDVTRCRVLDKCPWDYWDEEEEQYTFDWKDTKVKRVKSVIKIETESDLIKYFGKGDEESHFLGKNLDGE